MLLMPILSSTMPKSSRTKMATKLYATTEMERLMGMNTDDIEENPKTQLNKIHNVQLTSIHYTGKSVDASSVVLAYDL